MDKNYFSNYKDGGAVLSGGIFYQDLVSLFYLFKYIEKTEFKEITFETYDDFTLIMDKYEICVQVKNTQLTLSSIKKIIDLKFETVKSDFMVHHVVASSYDKKSKSLIRKKEYVKNSNDSSRNEKQKLDIKNEFNKVIEKSMISPEMFNRVVFEEIAENQIVEAVKFHIYQWSTNNNWDIDINDFFSKLIEKVSIDLRPKRGFLNKKMIEELTLQCPKKIKHTERKSSLNNIYPNESKEAALLFLTKDIAEESEFSDKLSILKIYIELNEWGKAKEISSKIKNYKESFLYYYLYTLYSSGEEDLLAEQCQQLIEQKRFLYYANYFQGLLNMRNEKYYKAIDSMKYSLLENDTFEVHFKLAELYKVVGKANKSLEHYQFCLAKQPRNPEVLIGISPLLPKHKSIEYLDQAIEINSNLYNAYLEKGKVLRFYGLNNDAYDYFLKYLSFMKNINDNNIPLEIFKEISLCLLSVGNIKAIDYLNQWLEKFLFEGLNKRVKSGESIIILDNSLHNLELIVCTKAEEDFIIDTGILKYTFIKGEESKILIGCTLDSFLSMVKEQSKKFKSELEFEDGYEYLPSIIKIYWSKKEFDKVIKSIYLEENMCLNKDYKFRNEKDNLIDFKEYISKPDSTKVIIEELQNALNIRVIAGNQNIMGWFKTGGEGYFKFCSRVEKSDEAILILECAETNEIIHIRFSVKNVEISKKSLFRQSYVRDIEIPLL